ncbi:MAG: helix-turn-helix domain-containing protein [Ardenticatenaceae bacterium]|nr:helix-turn-helix domain-containing protein [Anaerolineales bacterium]MCB8923140.1 helix-turn-helix domain-containing protein [Ardenticatenaceae bacterium]MCB9005211.1 helix-turn-helix domain-containing protein [Ardenticatenaceae bacterium]
MSVSEWITTAEAAELSGYHVERIRELLRESKVAGRKFGPIWQVNRTSLFEYLHYIESQGARRGPKSQK